MMLKRGFSSKDQPARVAEEPMRYVSFCTQQDVNQGLNHCQSQSLLSQGQATWPSCSHRVGSRGISQNDALSAHTLLVADRKLLKLALMD
jgi:hypothetical protein